MDGLPVEFGETISRTGVMLVRVDGDYDISQDGIEWSPIGSVDGADEYVAGSVGRISIKVSGREVFFFNVSFPIDFDIATTIMVQQDSDNNVIERVANTGSYSQSQFLNDCVRLRAYASGNIPVDQIMSLGCTCNQEGVTITPNPITSHATWILTGFDKTQHLEVRAGNVLIAFVLPSA